MPQPQFQTTSDILISILLFSLTMKGCIRVELENVLCQSSQVLENPKIHMDINQTMLGHQSQLAPRDMSRVPLIMKLYHGSKWLSTSLHVT